jgi:hypothetical protein
VLSERTAQAFLHTIDQVSPDGSANHGHTGSRPCLVRWYLRHRTAGTLSARCSRGTTCGCARTTAALRRSAQPYMIYHRCGTSPVPLRTAGATDSRLTLQFTGGVAGAPPGILSDTGAAGCFANTKWCANHRIAVKPRIGSAELPNGEVVHYKGQATLVVAIQDLRCQVTFNVLDLTDDYDVILGDPWAKQHQALIRYGAQPCVRISKKTKLHVLYPAGATDSHLEPPAERAPRRRCKSNGSCATVGAASLV